MQASERAWRWRFGAVLMLLTTIPYFLAYAVQGDGLVFTGFVLGVEDGNSYIAKMLLGASGGWLFRTPYTTVPQAGVLSFFPYILLGKLTSPPAQHEQLVALFHLFRFGAGMLMVAATYDFMAYFVESPGLRRFGTAVACAGGGLGWLLLLFGQDNWLGSLPLDFYSPETFGFLSIYSLPHLAFARAMLLWGLLALLDHKPVRAGLFWLVLGFFQPATALIAWAVAGVYTASLFVVRRDVFKAAARQGIVTVLVSSPLVVYTAVKFSTDPFLKGWTAQNLIRSPHPLHYAAAFALFLPFAFHGGRLLLKTDKVSAWLPVIWVVMIPFLAYLPYPLQRRLPEGAFVAMIVLVMVSLSEAKRPRVWRGVLSLSFLSSLVMFAGGLMVVSRPAPPLFLTRETVAAYQWLNENASFDAIVLASYDLSNALPAWFPGRVVIGHGPESVNLAEIRPEVDAFLSAALSEDEALALLERFEVDYVIWDNQDESPYSFLVAEFENEQLKVLTYR